MAACGLKFCPVIVTILLIAPLTGVKEEKITGEIAALLVYITTVPLDDPAATISGLPSAFKSPTAMSAPLFWVVPVLRLKLPISTKLIAPTVLTFLSTVKLPADGLSTIKSILPSPFRSPIAE